MPVVTIDTLHRFTAATLRAAGVNDSDADTTAGVLTMTDSWGVFTHGTKLLHEPHHDQP